MIPPADSLLKYDTPVLVSRNTEKRSPKVRRGLRGRLRGRGSLEARIQKGPGVEEGDSRGIRFAATGREGNWDGGRRMGERNEKPRWGTLEGRFRMRKEVKEMDGAHPFS